MLLSELCEKYCHRIEAGGRSPSTIKEYTRCCRDAERAIGKPIDTTELSEDLVVAISRKWQSIHAKTTTNKKLRHLMVVWRYGVRRGLAPSVPSESCYVTVPKRVPRAWSPDDVAALIDACDAEDGIILAGEARFRAAIWWRAVVMLIYDTGARIGAILDSKIEDYDLDRRLVTLAAENAKTDLEQVLGFSRETARALVILANGRGPGALLFERPWSRVHFYRRFRRIVERAKVDGSRGKFHRLRRTRATQGELIQPGSATRDLGHASSKITRNHYIDPTFFTDDVASRLPRPWLKEGK